MNDLLELGKQYKSTKDWSGFLEIYSNYFKDYKDKEINILEIGIDKGESLKIWRKYFTRAKICGIDIIDIKFQIEGVDLIKADQTDKKALKEICDNKLLEVNALKNKISQLDLLKTIELQESPRGFRKALNSKIEKNNFCY